MPSVVSDKCVKCLSCTEVCPVDAFREDENMLVIDPDVCIDCGICIGECPEGAISSDMDAEEKWVKYNEEKAPTLPVAGK